MSIENGDQTVDSSTSDATAPVRERILAAARELAEEEPLDRINLAKVARRARVSWPTVRRHVGSRRHLRALLVEERPELVEGSMDTRSRILASASKMFAEHGYEGAILDEVAADADLTKGAVYWHFASKSDLFLALLEERVGRQERDLPEAVRRAVSLEGGPADRLAALLADRFATLRENKEWPRLFLEFSASAGRDPEVHSKLHRLYGKIHQIIGEAVEWAQDEGRIDPDLDPMAVAVLLNSLINGLLLTWLVYPEQADPDQLVPELAWILWRGIGGMACTPDA